MSGVYPTDPPIKSISFEDIWYDVSSQLSTGGVQSRWLGGQRFDFTARYEKVTEAEFAPVRAFLMRQRGRSGIFTVVLPVLSAQPGTVTGTARASAAHAIGDSSIGMDGFAGTLKAGTPLVFAGQTKVYMVVEDQAGAGTVEIEPPLFEAVADNDVVTYDGVAVTVKLKRSVQRMRLAKLDTFNFEVDFEEVVG